MVKKILEKENLTGRELKEILTKERNISESVYEIHCYNQQFEVLILLFAFQLTTGLRITRRRGRVCVRPKSTS